MAMKRICVHLREEDNFKHYHWYSSDITDDEGEHMSKVKALSKKMSILFSIKKKSGRGF